MKANKFNKPPSTHTPHNKPTLSHTW